MKWMNKGHEFDSLGERVRKLKAVYLFGAGQNGLTAMRMFDEKIRIKGFIDNDPGKQGTAIDHCVVYPLDAIHLAEDEAIVVCVQPSHVKEVMAQLAGTGYAENVNAFSMHVFFPLYDMYAHNKVCLSSLSFLPTTVCNLNCRHCLNFAPYIKKQRFRPFGRLVQDLQLLFSRVDSLMLLHLSGGEPFLYPQLPELITFITMHFGNQIGRLEMTTNGTIMPSDGLCEALKAGHVILTVDDYLDSVPQYAQIHAGLLKKLQAYGIEYHILKAESWIDLAPFDTDHSAWSDERLCRHFDDCSVPWQEYRDGKLWLCNYAAYASAAGLDDAFPDEFFDLHAAGPNDARALLEFRMGYSEKGFANFCRRCRGYGNNTSHVKVAEQMDKC